MPRGARALRPPVLGVDIGRVIIAGGTGHADTSFFDASWAEAMRTPEVPLATDVLALLTVRFEGRVHLVSKAGPRIQALSRDWLRENDFWDRTGIDEANLAFCRERRDKAGLCAARGVTDMIDDRMDVLVHLEGVVDRRYLFGPQHPRTQVPDDVVRVPDWLTVAERFDLPT